VSWTRWPKLALAAGVGVALLAAMAELPVEAAGLRDEVLRYLDASGVQHPVTAVLMNFRGYDTWLEVVVLLLAALAALALGRSRDLRALPREAPASAPLALTVRLLVPVMIIAGGYLLWLGKAAPGGAFQAGVILGAAGLLLQLSGLTALRGISRAALYTWLLLGPAAFALFGTLRLAQGAALLSFPAQGTETFILLLETLLAFSVGGTLMLLVVATRPPIKRVLVVRAPAASVGPRSLRPKGRVLVVRLPQRAEAERSA
jgi:multisubunit Na+/H+ antiporter MnhB subunit